MLQNNCLFMCFAPVYMSWFLYWFDWCSCFGNHQERTSFWCLLVWNRLPCVFVFAQWMQVEQILNKEHSKKHPKDLSPSNRGRLMNMGALMFQIHIKPKVVLLFGFGFRLGCLECLLRSILKPTQSLIKTVLKETKCFSKQRENNRLIHRDNRLLVT